MIGKKINQLATELAPVSTDLTIIGDPTTGVSKKITLAQLGAIFSGAVSFYTNLAGFPATGDINVIYCAKDTQKLYLWSGSAYVEVFPSQALLDTYQLRSEKGNANGYASLDSQGKVPISQLPSSIMEYKGTWNASTNTPTLANGTGDTGDVYICNVAGTVNFGAGPITFAVGDYVIYSGTIWQRSSGAVGTVTSVAATITGDAIGITGSPVTTSGTLAFAFAGTGAQYIKGDGTLATFPSTIAQAERLITEVYNSTGATLTKGTIVYINGGQGNLPTVTKALATGDSTSAQTFGVVQADITNNNNGYVVVAGKLSDLDTQAYTEGTQLYLSATTAGTWTSTKQYAPNHLVYVGIVVRSHPTQGIVEIKIQNGYELDELHDVAAQNPDNNDILQYKTSTSLWTKVAGTTSNIAEGSNLYYTDARSRAALSFTAGSGAYNSTTGVITIPTNTNQLTNGAAYITLGSLSAGAGISYNNTTGVIASTITQYTDAMARASISLTTTGTSGAATYNSTTGVLNVPQYAPDLSGYVPTSRTLTINGTAYDLSANRSWSVGTVTSVGLSSATSGVTIGSTPITTSGTITLAIATASGSQQGLLSSTDWTTFNNKQNALTNPVTGTGTTNYLPKFTGTSTIGNSLVQDNGSTISISTNSTVLSLDRTGGATALLELKTGGTVRGYLGADASMPFVFFNQSPTALMYLNSSGNLGLGVTPQSWWSSRKVVEIFNGGAFAGVNAGWIEAWGNSYLDAAAATTRYLQSGYASLYQLGNMATGGHIWFTAPSGTAGNAISFTQAMTLFANGNLGLGTTSDSGFRLDVYGQARIYQPATNSANYLNIFNNRSRNAAVLTETTNGGFYAGTSIGTDTFCYQIYDGNAGASRLTIASTGAATFSSSVTASTGYYLKHSNGTTVAAIEQFSGTQGAGLSLFNSSGTQNVLFNAGGDSFIRGGNVGIGTTNPGANFILDINSTKPSGASGMRLSTQSTSAGPILVLNYTGASLTNWGIGAHQSTSGALEFVSSNSAGGDPSTAGTARMLINSSGNVGINTTSILGSSVERTLHLAAPSSGYATLYLTNSANTLKGIFALGEPNSSIFIGSQSNHAFGFVTNDTERMRITSGGALCVGRTTAYSAGYLLNVEGNIYASAQLECGTSIQTGAPTNGTARQWKLGNAVSGTITPNNYIIVEINGTTYTIPALQGLP